MIYGFVANGDTVYEQSEVICFEETESGVLVRTAPGTLLARRGVVVAVHSSTHTLLEQDNSSTIAFYT